MAFKRSRVQFSSAPPEFQGSYDESRKTLFCVWCFWPRSGPAIEGLYIKDGGKLVFQDIWLYTKDGGKPVFQGILRHVHDSIFQPLTAQYSDP